MNGQILTQLECQKVKPGAAASLTAIMAILAIAIVAVVVYRMMKSSTGSAKIPGGWSFSWK